MANRTLIDANVLIAAALAKDTNHAPAVKLLNNLRNDIRIVLTPVLAEVFYMVSEYVSYQQAIQTILQAQASFSIEPVTPGDIIRMGGIMMQYTSAQFDFADTAIMAIAERVGITRIATFDRRDFTIFRPTHCRAYELLP